MDWSILQTKNPITQNIVDDWNLLLTKDKKEHYYHDYIKNHAGMFLVDGVNSFFSLSKIKLGSDLETDFAVPWEEYSLGLYWELIEIKTPSAVPYNKNGTPSTTLTQAIQQVEDWKSWLKENRSVASRLFQSRGVRVNRSPNFRFTIIIGTEKNSEKFVEKRNNYGKSLNIQIRSFDYLTRRMQQRFYVDRALLLNGLSDLSDEEERRQLANPFYKALTDSKWKKLLSEPGVTYPHFTSRSFKYLLEYLEMNDCRYNEFVKFNEGT